MFKQVIDPGSGIDEVKEREVSQQPSRVRVEVDPKPDRYYACATQLSDFNLYQTPAFGDVTAGSVRGYSSSILVFRDEQVIGACLMRIKTIPLTRMGIAYALSGPLWRSSSATCTNLADVLTALREEYVHSRRLSVRLYPRLWREHPDAARINDVFARAGFVPSTRMAIERTFLVDLSPPLEEIRGRIQRRWRNYLSQAERSGLELSTDRLDSSFVEFIPLYLRLKRSKHFQGIDEGLMRLVHAALPEPLKLEITLCRNRGRLVAGHIASHLGDTCLGILAANNEEARECRAANLIWWERFKRAKADCRVWYDLGGFDFETNRSVAEAKSRLGGVPLTFFGEYRCEPSLLRAELVRCCEKFYRGLWNKWRPKAFPFSPESPDRPEIRCAPTDISSEGSSEQEQTRAT